MWRRLVIAGIVPAGSDGARPRGFKFIGEDNGFYYALDPFTTWFAEERGRQEKLGADGLLSDRPMAIDACVEGLGDPLGAPVIVAWRSPKEPNLCAHESCKRQRQAGKHLCDPCTDSVVKYYESHHSGPCICEKGSR